MDIIVQFCNALGLILNRSKSRAYWSSYTMVAQPPWTNLFQMIWVTEGKVSKLLGTPFGMGISSLSGDEFLIERVLQKLQHWCTMQINSTRRSVIVNYVLLASILFFASIWGGTLVGIKKVTFVTMNFIWSGSMHKARTKVSWLQCCQELENGGINTITPQDALTTFIVK